MTNAYNGKLIRRGAAAGAFVCLVVGLSLLSHSVLSTEVAVSVSGDRDHGAPVSGLDRRVDLLGGGRAARRSDSVDPRPPEAHHDILPLNDDVSLHLVLELRLAGGSGRAEDFRLSIDPHEIGGSPDATSSQGGIAFGPMPLPSVPRHMAARFSISIVGRSDGRTYAVWSHRTLSNAIRAALLRGDVRLDPLGKRVVMVSSFHIESEPMGIVRLRAKSESGDPVPGVDFLVKDRSLLGRVTGPDGALEWRFRAGTHAVTARRYVLGSGYVSETKDVDVRIDGVSSEVEFVLPGSSSISGSVVWPDKVPIAGIEVVATSPAYEFRVARNTFYLLNDQPQWVTTITRVDGSFAFEGSISTDSVALWYRNDDGTMHRAEGHVPAGSTDVRLVAARHRVRILLRDAASGLDVKGKVSVVAIGGGGLGPHLPLLESNASPRTENEFVAPPGSELTIVVNAMGYQNAREVVRVQRSPYVQSIVVPVNPESDKYVVRIEFMDDRGSSIQAPQFRVVDSSDSDLDADIVRGGPFAEIVGVREGSIKVVVPPTQVGRPNLKAWEYLLPIATELLVRRMGDNYAVIRLRVGGRIMLRFRVEEAFTLGLVDAMGLAIDTMWSGGRSPLGVSTPTLQGEGMVESNAISGGVYRLRLSSKSGEVTEREVVVVPGVVSVIQF